ncbi:hypothetical protein [Paenibacillus dokdonensis]|uniref:hypothetical protein n=1 Tax=Paenibacillus dokdonensis TaxID=2567944 RepID=UPI0010A889A2|nr:hypothetical protein [Paenibacillus dokdonensis]
MHECGVEPGVTILTLNFCYLLTVEWYVDLSSYDDSDNDDDGGHGYSADLVGNWRHDNRDDVYVLGRNDEVIGDLFVEILERYSFPESLIFPFRLVVDI